MFFYLLPFIGDKFCGMGKQMGRMLIKKRMKVLTRRWHRCTSASSEGRGEATITNPVQRPTAPRLAVWALRTGRCSAIRDWGCSCCRSVTHREPRPSGVARLGVALRRPLLTVNLTHQSRRSITCNDLLAYRWPQVPEISTLLVRNVKNVKRPVGLIEGENGQKASKRVTPPSCYSDWSQHTPP